MLDLCLLGIGGMMPLPGRWLSACLLRTGGETLLFDCGEGTQIAWRAGGWPFKSTGTILLSHVDADHVAGLPGVLFQIAHSGRTDPVTIYGPERTHEIVSHLVTLIGWLPYELRVAQVAGGATLELPGGLRLSTLDVQHGKPCLAYTLDLPRAPRFDPQRARALGVPVQEWKRLQRGEAVGDVRPEDVTGPPRRGLKVALVTDTRYFDELVPFVAGSDLLVCEAMYPGDDEIERAVQRGHMTATQAARLARAANVRRLWLTHLSPSVENPDDARAAAASIFPSAQLGQPGETVTLRFDNG
jgi:ribonuclease Z